MTGVEILSQANETITKTQAEPICIVISLCLAIMFLVLFVVVLTHDGGKSAVILFGITMLQVIATMFLSSSKTTETGNIIYKVTISEDVKLVEFNEKYEIISQEGKIFTIKEHENGQ